MSNYFKFDIEMISLPFKMDFKTGLLAYETDLVPTQQTGWTMTNGSFDDFQVAR